MQTAADTTTTVLEPVADRLPADPEAPAADWVAGINAAGWDFHRHLMGNTVSSPMSIGTAFSLSRAGASADSGTVLDKIFGFPEVGLHSAANAVDLRLAEASTDPTTLEVANRLFPDDGFSPQPEFLATAAAHYGATIQPVDTADGAAAAETINQWVSHTTRGLIPTIVTEDVVQDQELVLVNTVYLKADWVEPFLPDLTSDGQFSTGDNRSVTVPFMRDREPVDRRYVQLEDADAVELPYQGGGLAMWLIVPHNPAGLAASRNRSTPPLSRHCTAPLKRVLSTSPCPGGNRPCRPPTYSHGSARWGSAPAPASPSPVASSSPPRSTAPK